MKRIWLGLLGIFLISSGGLLAACGNGEGDSREYVYLHVFNGYPGASAMTIYGPTGQIAEDLPYGARTNGAVRVDRNLGTNLTFVLDGAPQTFDAAADLFAMYPAETATLFVSRRDDNAIDFRVFRHIPSISANCRIVLGNAIPSSPSDLANHSAMFAWNFGAAGLTVGDTLYYQPDPREEPGAPFTGFRFSDLEAHPYFFFVELEDDEFGWVWVGRDEEVDVPLVDFDSGTIRAHPPTFMVEECLDDVVEPPPPVDPNNPTVEEQEARIDFDNEVEECMERQQFQSFATQSGMGTLDVIHFNPGFYGSNSNCDAQIRIFSDFANIFDGEHQDGDRREFSVSFGASEHFFAMIYGFPVNPRVTTWNISDESAGGGFEADLSAFDPN